MYCVGALIRVCIIFVTKLRINLNGGLGTLMYNVSLCLFLQSVRKKDMDTAL